MSLPTPQPEHTNTRKMRIYNRYFTRAWSKHAVFPEIRLSGRWLMESGFTSGQHIRVTHERHKIVITVEEEQS